MKHVEKLYQELTVFHEHIGKQYKHDYTIVFEQRFKGNPPGYDTATIVGRLYVTIIDRDTKEKTLFKVYDVSINGFWDYNDVGRFEVSHVVIIGELQRALENAEK